MFSIQELRWVPWVPNLQSHGPGAVVAILRVVEKLSPKGDQEIEDENVESLQAAFLTLKGYKNHTILTMSSESPAFFRETLADDG